MSGDLSRLDTRPRTAPNTPRAILPAAVGPPLQCARRADAVPPGLQGQRLFAPTACAARRRSEEHTSELQSLMRISYAVFCLKKKKHTPSATAKKLQSRHIKAQ